MHWSYPMTETISERAREVLAAAYEKFGGKADAVCLRDSDADHELYAPALDALKSALAKTGAKADGEREDFLSQLRRVNTERYHAWVGDGQDAGILFDAAELGGEVGELLNVVKKLVREEAGWRGSRAAPEDFADECADVLICLDKLARRRGVDLIAATVAKFNATSDKVGLPHKLATPPQQPSAEPGAGVRP
jgi:NTP pyrophosphatase (non-canonical NTP hydrolase)